MINWKRGVVLFLFSLVLLSSVVYGSTPTGIEEVDKIINVVFNLNDELGLKLIFALLVFTVLFGVSEFIFKNWAKGIRVLLAVTVSIMTVTFIPHRLLASISKTYGVLFVFVMIGVPVLGAIYFLFGVLTEKTKFTYAIKAAICGVLWYVLGALANDVKGIFGAAVTLGSSLLGGFEKFSVVVSSFFLIMMIYYGVKVLSTHHEESPEDFQAIGQPAGAAAGWLGSTKLGSWAKSKFVNTVKAEEAFTITELEIVEKVRSAVDNMIREMVFEVKELSKEAGKITEEELENEKKIISAKVDKLVDGIIKLMQEAERQGYNVFRLARRSRNYSGDETKIGAQEQVLREKMDTAIAELQAFKALDVGKKYMEYGDLRNNLQSLLMEIYQDLAVVLKEIKGVKQQAEATAALPTRRFT